ncbi:hypothetical protein Pcinc_020013 [Petrolisthes cinctipes]|uniref:Pro-resilin n=1 Tax=Petrolisthes cinctipes TaxID=88211 RepID=A0AAE1KKC7_PETCI|nr:hypothetical protein Pcinc_020013 [Petrolisthes cinctipes]
MNAKLVIVLGLAVLAAADSGSVEFRGYGVPSSESRSFESYESSEAKYDFQWAVKDDSSYNDFGHQEGRDGDNTQGSYYVHLPDGRLQKVTYYVDGDDGYIADVKYDGSASFESGSFESGSSESGSYEAPRYTPPQARYYDSNESNFRLEILADILAHSTLLPQLVIVLGLAALAAADSGSVEFRGYGVPSSESRSFESYESSEAKYDFQWAVKDDSSYNDFGHQEGRDGDNTQGSYYVHLPDGRLQKVTYYVDGDDGYIADVKYDGSASFESGSFESGSSESGSYEAPRYTPPQARYYDSNESK